MKIANNILYALAAALLMVGCAKVEPDFGNKQAEDLDITFQVGSYAAATKADAHGHVLYQDVPFGTFCNFTPGNFADGNPTLYMPNVEIKHNNGVWAADATYRWPKAGKLSFASYSPYSENTKNNVELTGEGYIRFYDYIVGGEDLMYSTPVFNRTANEHEHYVDGVPTLFNHTLTWVEFKFTTSDSKADKCWIEIASATVDNCINKGNFNSYTEKWSAASTDAKAATTNVRGEDAVVYFMPQDLSSVKLTVTGVIKNRVLCADGTTTEDFETPFERQITLGGSWSINTHVIYNVDVLVGEKLIKFGVTTTNWETKPNITLQ